MNDVCPLLLCCPDEKVDVLGSSLLRKVADDVGQCILNRFCLTAVEDAEGIISARVANRAVIPGLTVLNTATPNPAELRLGGRYLPSPVVYTIYGILDNVWIDAYIVDVVLESSPVNLLLISLQEHPVSIKEADNTILKIIVLLFTSFSS